MGSVAEPNAARGVVDGVVGEVLDLGGGRAVQQCEQTDQRLMRVDVWGGAPAMKQDALSLPRQCWAAESPGLRCYQFACGVDEDSSGSGGESEELPQPDQVEGETGRTGVQERLDVGDVDGGLVGGAALGGKEDREVADRVQASIHGGVLAGVGVLADRASVVRRVGVSLLGRDCEVFQRLVLATSTC
jgi:hypothetical protein